MRNLLLQEFMPAWRRVREAAGLLRRRLAVGVLLAMAWLSGAGCSPGPAPALRIGINAWPGYELLYLAQEKGFFREAGLSVRLVEFHSLSDARRAWEEGKLDGLATTVIEVLMARDANPRDLRIASVVDFSSGADVIVAGSGVRSMAGLRGRKVGVELASLGIYVLTRALEREGMTLADVRPVSIDQKSMHQPFQDGGLDAVVTYPPASHGLLRDPRFRVVFSTREIPGEVADVLAMDGDLLRQRPADIAALLKSVERAFDFLRHHPDEACRIMGEREGLSGPDFQRLLSDGITLVAPTEQAGYFATNGALREVMARAARTLREVHLISDRPGLENCLASP